MEEPRQEAPRDEMREDQENPLASWIQNIGGVKYFSTHYERSTTLHYILCTLTNNLLDQESSNGSLRDEILSMVEENKCPNRMMATKMRIMTQHIEASIARVVSNLQASMETTMLITDYVAPN